MRSSFALGLVWGVMALLNWAMIAIDAADADWFRYLGAVLFTCAGLGYLNSARVLRRAKDPSDQGDAGAQ